MSDCTDVKKALVLVESYCRRGEAEKRHQENRWALLDNVQAIRQLGELQENTEKKKTLAVAKNELFVSDRRQRKIYLDRRWHLLYVVQTQKYISSIDRATTKIYFSK